MSSRTQSSYSLPPAIRRIVDAFRITGWISCWAQLVLAVVSTLVLLFAVTSLNVRSGNSNPGTSVGLLFAVCGLAALYAGAYWAFSYTRLSRKLKTAEPKSRPKPGDVIRALRIGLIINLAGMLLSLLGAQAIVGALLAKALAQPQGGAIYNPATITQFIQSLDIFVVQANTNTISAHFVGVVASLWLIRSMNRQ